MPPINIDRDQALAIISATYPADSQYTHTRQIGLDLLEKAREACHDWRNEPDDVLIVYAGLCLEEQDWHTNALNRALDRGEKSLKTKLRSTTDV